MILSDSDSVPGALLLELEEDAMIEVVLQRVRVWGDDKERLQKTSKRMAH